jgi:hypothetical protein
MTCELHFSIIVCQGNLKSRYIANKPPWGRHRYNTSLVQRVQLTVEDDRVKAETAVSVSMVRSTVLSAELGTVG